MLVTIPFIQHPSFEKAKLFDIQYMNAIKDLDPDFEYKDEDF